MKVAELINIIDKIAPFYLQLNFDNSGIQFGDLKDEVNKILLCLDVTPEVIDEAISLGCNAILSHHPLFFQPLKSITKQDNPIAYQLITNKINLLAAHTNYDLAENGLNDYVGKLLGLEKFDCLEESSEKILKLAVYVPEKYQDTLIDALFEAGAGNFGNYSETSFSLHGSGTFKPMEGTNPFIGETGTRETVKETKIETVFQERFLSRIVEVIHKNHPYEEQAYDIFPLISKAKNGIGLIARLPSAVKIENMITEIKNILKVPYLRLIRSNEKLIKTIALCTGSSGSLINKAINKKADLFITGDIKHHEALAAKEMGLNIIDIEHFYTEKYFVPAIKEQLMEIGVPDSILYTSKIMSSPFELF